MNFSFESPDLDALLTDLDAAPERLAPAVRAVVSRGALNVKRDSAARIEAQRSGEYLKHYARSITYDLTTAGATSEAVIGPETGRLQGAFGPGVEFGSVQHAPMPHLHPALDAEEPKLLDALGDAAVRVIG